jgi:hypothetical protein
MRPPCVYKAITVPKPRKRGLRPRIQCDDSVFSGQFLGRLQYAASVLRSVRPSVRHGASCDESTASTEVMLTSPENLACPSQPHPRTSVSQLIEPSQQFLQVCAFCRICITFSNKNSSDGLHRCQ